MTNGPCGWVPTHTHHSAEDLAEWNAYPASTRTLADAAASRIMWSSTGRLFGACATIARPLLCPFCASQLWGSGSPWTPVDLGSGDWINLSSDLDCSGVDPARVKLRGPVNAVSSVVIGGVVFAAANYRLDEGEILVRTDGLSWPLWQDISLPGTDASAFVVNYTIGVPAPLELLAVTGTYALEFARATSPTASTTCRLPSRAKTITRQGLSIDMVDPTVLLQRGLTGIAEVDAIILALNPNRYSHQPRVLVPGGSAPVVGA